MDFSNVRDDKCHVGVGQSRVRSIKQMSKNPFSQVKLIKLTTCSEGAFTCNDGQCISMEQRSGFLCFTKFSYILFPPDVTKRPIALTNLTKSIANCCQWKWESISKLLFFRSISQSKDNYNKKIAPFSFDTVQNAVIPVNINVSFSVIDILKIEEVNHIYTLKFRLVLEW